jgi:hypothetical protein
VDVINRRDAMGFFSGFAALLGGVAIAGRTEAKDPPSANGFVGKWTYRSFRSIPDITTPFDKLEFWRATLTVDEPGLPGMFKGRLDGDPGEGLALSGVVSYGTVVTARFTGQGDQDQSKDWLYDYLAFLVPAWPNGVNQVPAIIGTTVRTKPHKSGSGMAPAGVVAQWIAVRRDA